MSDNWKHRSSEMKCRSCMWFVLKPQLSTPEQPSGPPATLVMGALGRCRRHAPTMNGFPAVFQLDWCGDHKLDENKI